MLDISRHSVAMGGAAGVAVAASPNAADVGSPALSPVAPMLRPGIVLIPRLVPTPTADGTGTPRVMPVHQNSTIIHTGRTLYM